MKKILQHTWPFIFIFSIWMLFVSPVLMNQKIPFPSDYLVNNFAPWSAYPEFSGPVKNSATPDVITQIFPWKKIVIDSWRDGQVPLWNMYTFSGNPLLANYQSAVFSPINLLYFVFPFVNAWTIQILLQPLLAGIFTYLFVRTLKFEKWQALISAIAFMFCGFITTWMVYGTLGYAILFLPLALYSIQKYYETKRYFFLLVLALTLPLSLFSGHFQTSIYFSLFVFVFILFKFITERKGKLLINSSLSFVFGLLLSAPQLIPSIELYLNSVRSGLFLKTEVIPWSYLPTFIAPDFFGNPVTRNDWFGHYAEWNSYIGLVPLLLAAYAKRNRDKFSSFFKLAALIILLLAFQTPLLDMLVALKIPVLSTSAASRIIVLFIFCISILAAYGARELSLSFKDRNIKSIVIWLGVSLSFFAILWIVVLFSSIMPQDKAQISFSNLRLPTILSLVFSVGIIFAYFIKVKKIITYLAIFIVLITSFDMLRFVSKWQVFAPIENVYPEVGFTSYSKTIDESFRVHGNFGGEASMMLGLPTVTGYDPLYIGRYGEFVAAIQDGRYHSPERSVVNFPINGQYTETGLNVLNIKYIAHKVSDGQAIWTLPLHKFPIDNFKLVYEDSGYQIFENQKVNPKAIIINNFEVQKDDREILRAIFRSGKDLKSEVVLEEDPGKLLGSGSAIVRKYTPNKIEVETNTSGGNSILFMADPFYPGWKALIDGQKTDIYRADYAFRAVILPEGRHVVSFIYDPVSFKFGLGLGLIGVIGLLFQKFFINKK